MITSLNKRKTLWASFSLVAALALGMPAAPALAHSMLVKAEPARRAVLTKSPSQVRLWFNEKIEGDYASLVVLDDKSIRSPISSRLSHLMILNQSSCRCPN